MKRSDLYKWAAIAGGPNVPTTPQPTSKRILVMRDQPSVRKLEDRLLLYGSQHASGDLVSEEVFGTVAADLSFQIPEAYWDLDEGSPEAAAISQAWDAYELQFETGDDLTDEETVELLLDLGIDFRDERGLPLRCTKLVARAAEAAARGIAGKVPSTSEVRAKQWEESLAAERDAFLAKRRGRA